MNKNYLLCEDLKNIKNKYYPVLNLNNEPLALISEEISEDKLKAEFIPIYDIIKKPLSVPDINSKLIYDNVKIKTKTFSYSAHLYTHKTKDKKYKKYLTNDKPNTPRTDFLWSVLAIYLKDNFNILEIGCGIAFIPAYIIQDKQNISYTGVDPQLEVHKKNLEIYGKYNNIEFINKGISNEHLKKKYDVILHCHPWIHIPNLFEIYKNIAENVKPTYFVIQTYGNVSTSPRSVNTIIPRVIDIFTNNGYKKCFQIYDLDINKLYFNNTWWSPTNQTIIILQNNI